MAEVDTLHVASRFSVDPDLHVDLSSNNVTNHREVVVLRLVAAIR
jgi:hypothetical protein